MIFKLKIEIKYFEIELAFTRNLVIPYSAISHISKIEEIETETLTRKKRESAGTVKLNSFNIHLKNGEKLIVTPDKMNDKYFMVDESSEEAVTVSRQIKNLYEKIYEHLIK